MALKQNLLALFLLSASISVGQVLQPAKWTASFSKSEASVGDKVDVVFKTDIDKDWHVYSNDFNPNLGPRLISFAFDKSAAYVCIGGVKPVNAHQKMDEIWGGEVSYFEVTGEMRQTILIKSLPLDVSGSVEYQACSDVSGQCVMGEDAFKLKMNASKTAVALVKTPETLAKPVVETAHTDTSVVTEPATKSAPSTAEILPYAAGPDTNTHRSWWNIFFLAFLGGLAAIFTPCVFPMIPMTISFFMHSDEKKSRARLNAFFYGFSIILIYTVIGTVVAVLFGANFANFLSTHWLPNVLFFLIFVVFAASFFGMFELVMPSWLVNKSVANEDKKGLAGSFFMALTLVLVSFSCTGPIVGAILVASAGGEILMPILGMLGFSLAFALPFTLFAIFPSMLGKLPKSGGWLNSVKVVLGFIELALGLKFLSIADQTYHWGILDREVYLAIWIVIFTMLGFYLLGKLRFPHDNELKHISVPRLMLSIVTFTFVVYMIPGMFGAPLKALSGYIPPQTTLDFDINEIVRSNEGNGSMPQKTASNAKYADFLHLPHGLNGYFDYAEGLAAAKRLNKPIFIDFTGHGCVNCREMEANVWSDPEVLRLLREEYVVIALYVDDKTELPQHEWFVSEYDGLTKKTLGKKNADFQITRYQVNAQPYYCLLDTAGCDLVKPAAYDLNVSHFVEFLQKGKEHFQQESN